MLRVAAAQASRRTALRTAVVRSRQIRQISTGRRYALFARRRFDRLAAATTASLESAAATPALSVVQHGGAAVILYGFYETDVMLLRLWTVSGLICYSVVPNAWRGNVLLAAWGSLFVGLNAYRLVELASERVPVWLDDDEWACYEASGLNRFVAPPCFKRPRGAGPVRRRARRSRAEGGERPVPELGGAERHRAPLGARPAPRRRARAGGLVGIPDLVEAKLLADSIAEDDPLRPTGSSSATRVKAQAGDKGARVLRWTAKDFRRAVDAEKDPKVQAQLIFYLNQQLLKSTAGPRRARKEYSNLLRAALSSGQVEAQIGPRSTPLREERFDRGRPRGLPRGPGLDDGGPRRGRAARRRGRQLGAAGPARQGGAAVRFYFADEAGGPCRCDRKAGRLESAGARPSQHLGRHGRRPRRPSPRPRGSRRTSAAARTRDSASPRS